MATTTKSPKDGEAAEGRREGKRWREREQAHTDRRRGRPLRKASMSDRDEMEDMTTATCSKLSPGPAARRGCIDSSATTDDQPYRRQQYLYPSSSSRIRGRLMERSALGPRTSLLSLSSWLLPSSYISTSLDLHISLVTYKCLPFPTSFTAYPARPTLTTAYVDAYALPHSPAYIHLLCHFTSLHSC